MSTFVVYQKMWTGRKDTHQVRRAQHLSCKRTTRFVSLAARNAWKRRDRVLCERRVWPGRHPNVLSDSWFGFSELSYWCQPSLASALSKCVYFSTNFKSKPNRFWWVYHNKRKIKICSTWRTCFLTIFSNNIVSKRCLDWQTVHSYKPKSKCKCSKQSEQIRKENSRGNNKNLPGQSRLVLFQLHIRLDQLSGTTRRAIVITVLCAG